MSKKLKLDLDELKLQSFITSLPGDQKNFLRGGSDESIDPGGCEEFDDTTGGGGGSGTSEPPYPTWYYCGTNWCNPLPTQGQATCAPDCG